MTGTVDSENRYWRANDNDQEEDEDEGAKCGKGGLASAPTPRLACGANWPGVNRLALEETAQFVRKFFRGRVAASRFLLQAFQADCFEIAWDTWIEQPRRNRFGVQDLGHKGR